MCGVSEKYELEHAVRTVTHETSEAVVSLDHRVQLSLQLLSATHEGLSILQSVRLIMRAWRAPPMVIHRLLWFHSIQQSL